MASKLQQKLKKLFDSKPPPDALSAELHVLASEHGFAECASFWMPTLYQTSPALFQTFMESILHTALWPPAIIASLLQRAEADGQEKVFELLYRSQWHTAEEWNEELLGLVRAPLTDEALLQALQRRMVTHHAFSEATAMALYRRAPLFQKLVRDNVPHWWHGDRSGFLALRKAVRQAGDEAWYWELFRAFASREEWAEEINQLLAIQVPPEQIVAELEKRHPSYDRFKQPELVRELIQRYGTSLLPYVQAHLRWLAGGQEERFLQVIHDLGDETLYWQMFFTVGTSDMWNKVLRVLLKELLERDAFFNLIEQRFPRQDRVVQRWQRWQLNRDVALALYQRDPHRAAPLLKPYLHGADPALFRAAEEQQDEEFLDFLTLHFMGHLSSLLYRAYPFSHWSQQADLKARREIEEVGQIVTARLDRLYTESPEGYVRHAGYILGQVGAYGIWNPKGNREHNPIFIYLMTQHPEAWQHSPAAIQELMESPNIYIQRLALDILGQGSAASAQRVAENLTVFRTLLLNKTRRNSKKKALHCLEEAVRQCPDLGEVILPLLEEAMDFRSKRAIPEHIMVSFVRLRRQLRATS
ncbi:MAG: hypothetical protein H0T73_23530 [Ardenticatenales bacterium]|nr:hypothetical protein [Ardenticatenales bacterium]